MQKPKILLRHFDLTIEVESHPGDELIRHMHDTLLGMPGGFQYYHTNVSDRLHSLDENYFLYLRKSGKMLGSVGFCGRVSEVLGFRHNVWMVRYFSIKAPMRSVPSETGERDSLEKRSSVLGRFIKPVIDNPSLLKNGKQKEVESAIIFGIIDQTNIRSRNFAGSAGFQSIGRINFFPFSRFRPKLSTRVSPLPDKEQGKMIRLLNSFYKDYTLLTTENLFQGRDYYVIREKDEIIAGMQVYPVTWNVVNFGSGFANGMIRMITAIPYFRRRINPKNLNLLAFDGMYVKKGSENILYELMEGVLALKKVYVGLIIADEQSHLNNLFNRIGKRGPIYSMVGSFHADVMAKFINMPENVMDYYRKLPKYISSYDNS